MPSYEFILENTQKTISDLYEKQKNDTYFQLTASFRKKYGTTMQTEYDTPTNLTVCFNHYPLVDEYARKTNKPTALLLAMWYIESSCAMRNPDNRDGLFQIINNDYAP
jgi:hypothetical protein